MLQRKMDHVSPGHPGLPPFYRQELAPALQAGERTLRRALTDERVLLEARRSLVTTGQPQRKMHRLRSGWCLKTRYMRDGRIQAAGVLLPGDIVSVDALFYDVQSEEVVTVTPCEFEAVDHKALRDAALKDPELMLRLHWQSTEDARRLRNWVVALGRGSAEERLALLLLDVHGRLVLAAQIAPQQTSMPWPLTQHAVGDLLGLTPVHVNRIIRNLREAGLLSVRGHIAQIDLKGLHAIGGSLLDLFERARPEFGAPQPLAA